MSESCVFCRIINGTEPATIVRRWADAIAIVPLDPVTTGHLLVISQQHFRNVAESPYWAGKAMECAAELAGGLDEFNIITSAGPNATQSVWHTHLHVVPRFENDGLALPWYSGKRRRKARLADA